MRRTGNTTLRLRRRTPPAPTADAFDTTDVDIHVTNVDEKPDIWINENSTAGQSQAEGVFERDYEEESTAAVLTLMAKDPEGVRSIVWSLLLNRR